jgi:hypothetical protein
MLARPKRSLVWRDEPRPGFVNHRVVKSNNNHCELLTREILSMKKLSGIEYLLPNKNKKTAVVNN